MILIYFGSAHTQHNVIMVQYPFLLNWYLPCVGESTVWLGFCVWEQIGYICLPRKHSSLQKLSWCKNIHIVIHYIWFSGPNVCPWMVISLYCLSVTKERSRAVYCWGREVSFSSRVAAKFSCTCVSPCLWVFSRLTPALVGDSTYRVSTNIFPSPSTPSILSQESWCTSSAWTVCIDPIGVPAWDLWTESSVSDWKERRLSLVVNLKLPSSLKERRFGTTWLSFLLSCCWSASMSVISMSRLMTAGSGSAGFGCTMSR